MTAIRLGKRPHHQSWEWNDQHRHAFGIDALDRGLGGGLLPGSFTVIAGATGVGKTQLGLQWASAGLSDEGRRGVFAT